MNRILAIGIMISLAASMVLAQEQTQQRGRGRPEQQQQPPQNTSQAPAAQQRPAPPPEEKSSVTHHSARIGGQQINYTATAATYVIKADDGAPKATFFFAAYTKEDVPDSSKRPLSFVYNGGPGSASSYTHMGLGPKRIVLTDDGFGMPAPYSVVENGDSFLDATDMVFVDAVSTGYSRPVPGENTAQFYGVVQDATFFSDFIYQYLTRNERWASPKYLIGESYGTTRSAQLSLVLQQRHQIYLNGIALVSSVGFGNWGADDRTIYFLPTFVTSAWYHHLLPPDLQKLSIGEVAQQARQFAHGEYAMALEKGDELPQAEYQKVVKNLARFTGLSTQYIEQTNLRVKIDRFDKELLRSQRRTVGRLDGRFIGIDKDAAGESNEFDPSYSAIFGEYTAVINDYVRRELKFDTDLPYEILTGKVRPWSYDRAQNRYVDVAETLRGAIAQNPFMKVFVANGYYDLATPFAATRYTFARMQLEPELRKNISMDYFETGHMVYIDRKAQARLKKDVDEFIRANANVQ